MLADLRSWAGELGFSQIGVAGVDLVAAEPGLAAWLGEHWHGEMGYMAAHGSKRARPAELVPGTLRVVTARMDYLPRAAAADPSRGHGTAHDEGAALPVSRAPAHADKADMGPASDWRTVEWQRLGRSDAATVSLYARGRDYHKVMRMRLQRLADRLAAEIGPFGHRVFTDSAPLLEVELASRSGLGWRGKHTLTLDRFGGSMFFLGEICVDLALPLTEPSTPRCGTCSACLDICPTQAIVAPYRLDARRCISYLTIEHKGPIPTEFRRAIGNRIYGCDDCQLVCPWNKYASASPLADFDVRPRLDDPTLLELWAWTEADFLRLTEGSAIRRIGFERWQRNLAVAMGNALAEGCGAAFRIALASKREAAGALVREHIDWALDQSPATAPVEAA